MRRWASTSTSPTAASAAARPNENYPARGDAALLDRPVPAQPGRLGPGRRAERADPDVHPDRRAAARQGADRLDLRQPDRHAAGVRQLQLLSRARCCRSPRSTTQSAKTILGHALPANQTIQQDLDGAIDIIFNHPNVGPFLATRLIRALVTSNPSPAYIARVAAVFNDNGAGVRGDMQAVIRAILLDPEARNDTPPANFGRLRTPMQHTIALARALGLNLGAGVAVRLPLLQHERGHARCGVGVRPLLADVPHPEDGAVRTGVPDLLGERRRSTAPTSSTR